MLRSGVYSGMHDGNKQRRFRNEAQIEVRDDCIIYSTIAMVGSGQTYGAAADRMARRQKFHCELEPREPALEQCCYLPRTC